jgi:hypothetical protein
MGVVPKSFNNIKYALDCLMLSILMGMMTSGGVVWGWMCEYIYPYDDPYNPYLSPERKLRLGTMELINKGIISESIAPL